MAPVSVTGGSLRRFAHPATLLGAEHEVRSLVRDRMRRLHRSEPSQRWRETIQPESPGQRQSLLRARLADVAKDRRLIKRRPAVMVATQ